MSDNIYHFGFEESDDWSPPRRPTVSPPDEAPIVDDDDGALVGRDADRVVSVVVDEGAKVHAVRLARDWRASVDPRVLHGSVLQAANAATVRAMAYQGEQLDLAGVGQPSAEPGAGSTERPSSLAGGQITVSEALRLVDAALEELHAFTAAAMNTTEQAASAESAGGHVTGTARRGQVVSIEIDAHWVSGALNPEIEGELLSVLGELHRRSTPAVTTPQGPAITELTTLAADPQALLRAFGMRS